LVSTNQASHNQPSQADVGEITRHYDNDFSLGGGEQDRRAKSRERGCCSWGGAATTHRASAERCKLPQRFGAGAPTAQRFSVIVSKILTL